MIRALAAALVILVAVVINQSAVHWRSNIADDQLFAYFGWCITQGARPYLDVWDNKPPGIYWVNALGIGLCGPTRVADLLIAGGAVLTALVAFVGAARVSFHKSLPPIAAVVGALVLTDQRFESGGNRTETFVVAAEIVCICGYLMWRRTGRWTWLVVLALAGGTAPLFKQSGLAAFAACAIHALLAPRPRGVSIVRSGALAVVVFCVPVAVAACALAGQGALSDALYATGAFNRAYFEIDDATWWRMDRAFNIYRETALTMLLPVLGLAAIGLITALWARRATGSTRRAGAGLFLIWFLLAAYLASVGPGRRAHHFMPALTPLALLCLSGVNVLVARRGLARTVARSPGAVMCIVAFGATLSSFAAGNVAELQRSWSVKPRWYSLEYQTLPDHVVQGEALRRVTSPEARVYVWGWNPGAYRYSLRLPASRFATNEKVGQLRGRGQFILRESVLDLMANPPAAILISPSDLRGLGRGETAEFAVWVRETYRHEGTIVGMELLVRSPVWGHPESGPSP